MENKITIEAKGDFPFIFHIEKALISEENGELIITGIASTTNIDHDNERMDKNALVSMANIINNQSVPLRFEHQKEDQSIIGQVYKAWIDDRNQLWIKASLTKANTTAQVLYKSLKDGAKWGLSVGGKVKQAVQEFSEKTGKAVKSFYDVLLEEVSVTQRPANYDAYLFAKSIAKPGEDTSKFYDTAFYQQFLFENPHLDYIRAFAKSIPDKSWQKVESINNNNIISMKKNETTDTTMPKPEEKAEENDTKETTETASPDEKFASRDEFNTLKAMVAKGFEAVNGLFKKLAKEETTPEEEAEKEREGQETGEETGGQETPQTDPGVGATAGKSEMPPEEEFKTEEMIEEVKTEEEGIEEVKTEEEMPEEMKTEDEEVYGGEYQMKSIGRAVARLNRVLRKMESDGTGEVEEEETKKSRRGVASLDEFVFSLTRAVDKMEEKLENRGHRIPGFRKSIVDMIRNDEGLQKELRDMLREPGFKKSVSLGIPYMVTKEGKKYSLVAEEVGVKKSENSKGKSFKELYKTDYSAFQ